MAEHTKSFATRRPAACIAIGASFCAVAWMVVCWSLYRIAVAFQGDPSAVATTAEQSLTLLLVAYLIAGLIAVSWMSAWVCALAGISAGAFAASRGAVTGGLIAVIVGVFAFGLHLMLALQAGAELTETLRLMTSG